MKLLRVVANNFKLCEDDFTISFIPEGNKTSDDKEFELHEIDENLFVYSTLGIIGKNASKLHGRCEGKIMLYGRPGTILPK